MRLALRITATLCLAVLAALVPNRAGAKVKVVASITDLASIASTVGGDQVEVNVIAKPTADVHRIEALPSYMVRVSRADLYLKVGLGLDQWADALIDGSRNDRLTVLDCSQDVTVLDKPTRVDASMGDVHPFGNPHYWLDPRNGAAVARQIAQALGRLDAAHAADFASRAEAFAGQAEEMARRCAQVGAGLPNRRIVTYHASWVYFAATCGLETVATVEPVPGIPPTASHLQHLVDLIHDQGVPVVLYEPYFSEDAGEFLTRQTGVRIARVAPSCDGIEAGHYLAHFDALLAGLAGTSTPGTGS